MKTLSILKIVLVGVALAPAALDAQARSSATPTGPAASSAADSGVFVIRHGADTVATERFIRTATEVNGILAVRSQKHVSQAYQAVVAPDQSVAMIEVTVRETLDSGATRGRVVQRTRIIFKEDSASVDDITNYGAQTRVFGTERGAVPYLNLSFALLEQAVRRSRGAAPDRVALFNLGGGQTLDARLSPAGADSLTLGIGNVEFRLRVDPAGRVLGGRIPSQDVVAERVAGL